MEERAVVELDDDHVEFATILHSLGVQRNAAKVIACLASGNEATTKDIERGAGLRQPEVSIAMRTLRRENWIREWEVKAEGKGRPHKVYALAVPVGEIIGQLEEGTQKESTETMERIQRLKEQVSSWHCPAEPS
ncbi:ArsR family transcriptional regulator [Candidatus Methanocrinis natronophilus]|uniref:ArsR family transcriptional regulator n=1 Tax=Candidatus Methanocrinis natronophilus TaxID=3033396 RepID=A0ABT5X675_9EURY|nr:ArsR family transcriptional regulator [Candidatus Methanocrinis natronophilus]MDF0590198.1 ArsR family transcriptional regulator [Candidatus Methanocrinis natronophilus]